LPPLEFGPQNVPLTEGGRGVGSGKPCVPICKVESEKKELNERRGEKIHAVPRRFGKKTRGGEKEIC